MSAGTLTRGHGGWSAAPPAGLDKRTAGVHRSAVPLDEGCEFSPCYVVCPLATCDLEEMRILDRSSDEDCRGVARQRETAEGVQEGAPAPPYPCYGCVGAVHVNVAPSPG